MRYRLVAIGALKRGFYREACDHYAKRLGAFGRFEEVEVREARAADAAAVRSAESDALLAAAAGSHVIALDERGEMPSSRRIADRITDLETRGTSLVTLLVGGAEGHSDALRRAANEVWSLSRLTLPHELARLVLLEQLYRAETIRAGHPYHREG